MALGSALAYPVFGAAIIQVGTGASNALETLGYTQDGVTAEEDYSLAKIMTDVAGPMNPGEMQKFGIGARVTAPLISFVPTVWEKVQKRMADATTAGVLVTAGTLLHTNSKTFKVAIVSVDSLEDPFYFPTCIIEKPTNRKVGSQASPLTLNFFATAFHLATETTVAGKVVWARSTS